MSMAKHLPTVARPHAREQDHDLYQRSWTATSFSLGQVYVPLTHYWSALSLPPVA